MVEHQNTSPTSAVIYKTEKKKKQQTSLNAGYYYGVIYFEHTVSHFSWCCM